MYKHLHYKNTKYKYIIVVLTAVMVLSLAACGKTSAPNKSELSVSTDTQVEPSNEGDAPTNENPTAEADTSANDEAWKTEFEKSLLENYGVTPDHYEDLGDGVYQVYVEIDGKVIPYVTVDSATGDLSRMKENGNEKEHSYCHCRANFGTVIDGLRRRSYHKNEGCS